MNVSVKQPELDPEQLFRLVRDLMQDQQFRELKDAVARQKHIQAKLGLDRKAVNGLGEVTGELDPVLAQFMLEATKDADGTKHAEALNDPALRRVLAREGIEWNVRCGGTTTARVGWTPALADRAVRFRKTYA